MTSDQETALRALCARYRVPFRASDYRPAFDLPDGWVAGWVGGVDHQPGRTLYVGCSPTGDIHS